MARRPQGGDRDQIKGVAAGEADVCVANSYYYARMLNGSSEERAAAEKVAVVFPNQQDRGTHVNLSGVGVCANAPNKAYAVKFIEFLASDRAQQVTTGQRCRALLGAEPTSQRPRASGRCFAHYLLQQQMADFR